MEAQLHTLTISAVARETTDCSSFRLSVPRGLEAEFQYRAGQHLTVRLPWEGIEISRCYSLSSCPDLGEPLEIAVKRVEGGRASNWINDRLQAGDSIRASVPRCG